jgi:hypothetical protein
MASSGIKKKKERYNWRPVETRRIEDKSALEDCSFVLNQAKQKSGGFNRIQYLKSPIFYFLFCLENVPSQGQIGSGRKTLICKLK